ncbi:MAG TPA: tail fiber domain-containing protein [Rhizomicrobium sp.]
MANKLANKTVSGLLLVAGLTALSWPALGQQWHYVPGTILENYPTTPPNGQVVVRGVHLQSNNALQFDVNPDGHIYIPTPFPFPWYAGQAPYAHVQIQGGTASGLASYSFQPGDWGQNIQSVVGRANTVSYVVNWAGSDRFYVAGQGWIYANGAYFGSDRKLKTDIKNIEGALAKVMQLQGVTFQWKQPAPCPRCSKDVDAKIEPRTEMGLVAQDVEKVVPEVVRTVADGTKAVAYQNLVAVLIEAVKTQQGQIDGQAREIKELRSQIAQIKR